MNIKYYPILWIAVGIGLIYGCSNDTYEYPSVRLEFVTIESGSNGSLQTFVTDDGERLVVAEDKSQTVIDPDSRMRVLSNYEPLMPGGVSSGEGVIYAVGSVVSAAPVLLSEMEGEIKTDPVTLQSIWMGEDYLNMVLLIKAQSASHYFRFIEDDTETQEGATGVRIILHHDASNDVEAYTKKAYLSIPLRQYAGTDGEKVNITFCLNTYDGEEEKRFEYIPSPLY